MWPASNPVRFRQHRRLTTLGTRIDSPIVRSIRHSLVKLNHPLILAINTNDDFTSGQDEHEALLGIRVGIWRIDSSAHHQRLHGVLFFRGLFPSNMHSVVSHLYVNPNTQADVPGELLKLNNMWYRNGKWQSKKGMSLGEILELPENWPGEVTASKWHRPSP